MVLRSGIRKFFATDDNFAPKKDWEAIFDRLRSLRDRPAIVFWLRAARIIPKGGPDVTPEFASRSFMIIRSSMIIFGMVVGVSISTNAETVKVIDEASTDSSFTIAQTGGMERRGERRDTRQGCRGANGAVGADKRHCKQQGRQN
jgi:hypothetical protein